MSALKPGLGAAARPAEAARQWVAARRRRAPTGELAASALLALLGITFLLPMLWMLFASVDSEPDWAVRLPHLTLNNFATVVQSQGLSSFANSFYLAGVTTAVTTSLAALAAYPLSRRNVPLKRPFLYAILFATGLPISMLLVPTYQMYVIFGWLDSLFTTGLFLAASSLPFAIWLLKNFIDAVPPELEEAAAIDGAGTGQTLLRVVLPLTLPGIAVTAIYTFINAWGAFVTPLVLVSSPEHEVGTVAILHFLGSHGLFPAGQIAAYSLLFSLPVIVLYLVMSRHFSGAFTFGGGVQG